MKKPSLFLLLCFFVWSISFAQDGFYKKLALAGTSLSEDEVVYDPAYFSIPYPNGDIPKGKGVCTDVIIRAYRKLGIDLQQKVHEDMKTHFGVYPKNWGYKNRIPILTTAGYQILWSFLNVLERNFQNPIMLMTINLGILFVGNLAGEPRILVL